MAKERGDRGVAAAGPADAAPRGDTGTSLRLAALIAVAIGLLILAALACVLSYPSVHSLADHASVSPSLAKIYPVIFDAMLVIAGCSVLALRGGGLISRLYAWLCLLVLLAALAAASVVHAAGISLRHRPAAIAAATIPWALLLMAFGLLLALLRYAKLRRSGSRTAAHFAAGVEPEHDAEDHDGLSVSDAGGADEPEAAGQATDLDHAASPARPAQAAPTRPIARPADLQLRARVPASRTPSATEMVTPGQMPPVGAISLSGTTEPGGFDQPVSAEPGEPQADAPAEPSADPAEPAEPPSGLPTGRAAEPSADPPALRRPRSSPTPPEDLGVRK